MPYFIIVVLANSFSFQIKKENVKSSNDPLALSEVTNEIDSGTECAENKGELDQSKTTLINNDKIPDNDEKDELNSSSSFDDNGDYDDAFKIDLGLSSNDLIENFKDGDDLSTENIPDSDIKLEMCLDLGETEFSNKEINNSPNNSSGASTLTEINSSEVLTKPNNKCAICGEVYRVKETHMAKHTSDKPFECKICPMKFKVQYRLKLHMRIHDENRPTFSCDICKKSFASKHTIRTHMKVHDPNSGLTCNICGLTLSRKILLENHMRSHAGEKSFVCEVCGKSFLLKSYLRVHNRVHTGERPHECEICGRTFNRRSSLRLHKSYHLGKNERPLKCKYCDRTFVEKKTLKKHEISHTSAEYVFACESCDQKYKSLTMLKAHMKKIHKQSYPDEEKPLKCEVCGQSYMLIKHLDMHLKTKHNLDVNDLYGVNELF